MPLPPTLSPAQVDEAVLLYVEHEWTVPDIAEHFGCSSDAVRYVLRSRGVQLRPKGVAPTPSLRVKQCTHCLHFLPVALFSWTGAGDKRRPQSWCTSCTAHPTPAPWRTNPQPLAAAMGAWRPQ